MGYRRIPGELALLGVVIAASTVWEILKTAGVDPAPCRTTVTWVDLLCSQAEAILAMDFIETVTLTGRRHHFLAAIHHASRRVQIVGTTAHPTHAWVSQAIRNLLMDLEDTRHLAQIKSSTSIGTHNAPVVLSYDDCAAGVCAHEDAADCYGPNPVPACGVLPAPAASPLHLAPQWAVRLDRGFAARNDAKVEAWGSGTRRTAVLHA
ncbi:hypothetical protein JNUCC0626_07995 [Lentzea sp. JNUCC 0626]|uniref:hypothetical protein n=1 Tax=Lentzea sp. JNUCC 0626 TaxID=3367513 RepID=UPI0037484CC7